MIAPDITRLSTHYYNRPVNGRTVIIHATRSGHSMNPTEFTGTINWMCRDDIPDEQKVSSHWVIARDGTTARIVADDHQAWHAQEDNDNAWGIELEQGVEHDGFTDEQITSLVAVCKGYIEDFGVAPIHVDSSTDAGFIGHQETAQGKRNGKSDPGNWFPWSRFITALTPVPAAIDGIGVMLDGNEDVGNVYIPPPGRTIIGVGAHFTDGSIEGLWPK